MRITWTRAMAATVALMVMIALTNLIVVGTAPDEALPKLIRALSIFLAAAFGLLTVFFAAYRIPPPLIAFALLTIAFLVPAVKTKPVRSA